MPTNPYNDRAEAFFDQYQSLRFEDVHGSWLSHLPERSGFALDLGAGSGRDAMALADRGWHVLAVEPAAELRRLGEAATRDREVQWLGDQLPELSLVRSLSYRFDLILVSAVWMHVPPTQQERAFRILSELLAPGGTLVITLRHGPDSGDRQFYPVDGQALEQWARNRALVTVHNGEHLDRLGRSEVWWETLVFRLPDDGTGALPLLRHIIVNDNKSSTYKLGLLRALIRMADGVPGIVLKRTDDWVELPLGAVALYWIKLYLPLLNRHQLRQAPGQGGYGFAKVDFYALDKLVSAYDLRIGRGLSAEAAPTVLRAIKTAAANIVRMPVNYTTWPGTSNPVFAAEVSSFRVGGSPARLDRETLARFGSFYVPRFLWDCMSRYACWLEPAIVNEWAELMQGYEVRYDHSVYWQALQWHEDRRDTRLIRDLVNDRLGNRRPVHCVWSNTALKPDKYAVDHCFPWSRWSNNDLWNLLPSTERANSAKAEKLPAQSLMAEARPQILQWWDDALIGSDRETQFFSEAEAALPLLHIKPQQERTIESVFEGMLQQRLRLKMNQQLAEWIGLG
ncbi:MAG: methyltransferase domain-containing protein [Natronospirillum sp.]|uniref:methyltransferase domain-containing protein n=1 Tax=Natronospirillum sp. TaxID=2812955 RepID=UPI0025DB8BFA|nr:methyltransferase domain-containing protein [Natronospirillum sp.]MCH8552910.1 methyltransferase domain-containing protein [Natronospirillum sp.]